MHEVVLIGSSVHIVDFFVCASGSVCTKQLSSAGTVTTAMPTLHRLSALALEPSCPRPLLACCAGSFQHPWYTDTSLIGEKVLCLTIYVLFSTLLERVNTDL